MKTKISNAPRASSKSNVMKYSGLIHRWSEGASPLRRLPLIIASVVLASCVSAPMSPPPTPLPPPGSGRVEPGLPSARPGDTGPLPPALVQGKSRWVPVRWAELPGFEEDQLSEAWNAWLKSCERPGPTFSPLCNEVRRLSIASGAQQRDWMVSRLQPYRVETPQGVADGLLTSYYEPVLKASRRAAAGFEVPLYRTPAALGSRKPWFSRQEIDTLPEARSALAGREIAFLADPIDAMSLHIQGSGRLSLLEPDGSQRLVRVAFAGTNDQPYRSPAQWLAQQGVPSLPAPWTDSMKAWVAQNPQRVNQLLWSNPRYIFFREEALTDFDASFGPKGAQGVALTPGRSIAVDPASIPYGTPVWLASSGRTGKFQKLVLAQDTGSAIVGAVRADYFAGTGAEAGSLAATVNQPLRLWALWPK